MAKKSSKTVKASAAPPSAAATKKVTAPTKSSSPTLSNELIGLAAGQIWSALSDNGGLTIAAIKKSVDAPSDVVLAGLGWLAREDKLAYETAGRTVKVLLRK